jgi:YXWGXW repeat-containing protein
MNRNRPTRWILIALLLLCFSAASFAQVFVSVRIGPPALPVYAQPLCPGPGYIWTPGYWGWNDDAGYYWVPGTWVLAPVGLYWTPGYWGWSNGFYLWHGGYWGPHVGFYGGINYGFGYTGVGFVGGEWRGGALFYNRSVTNVNVTNVTNVYNKTVIVNRTTVNNVSFNGGTGGVMARPSPQEMAAEREQHREPIAAQMQHQQEASRNRELFARENHGRPAIAATVRPAEFHGRDVVKAKAAGAVYHPPTMSPREARGPDNAGNRPFTPPNAKENGNRSSDRSFAPPNAKENGRSNPKANDNSRPFSPPARDKGNERSASPMNEEKRDQRGNARLQPESRPQQHESHPQHESRPAPQQHEAAPKPSHHESAPQKHESAPQKQEKPRDEHHPGKGR